MQTLTDLPAALEPAVARYFEADARDAEALAACFTHDALVRDEGHEHRGRAAIASWKAESSRKYRYVSEPVAWEGAGDQVTVTVRVTGDFPGSPVSLQFRFALSGGLIRRLEIGS